MIANRTLSPCAFESVVYHEHPVTGKRSDKTDSSGHNAIWRNSSAGYCIFPLKPTYIRLPMVCYNPRKATVAFANEGHETGLA
jgi:hypothetical protein